MARAVDALYESIVSDPRGWTDERLAEWVAEIASEGEALSREVLKQVRSGMRNGRRIRKYWIDQQPPQDWEMAVDQALGGMGWDPGLRLAMLDLESSADPEAFDEVRRRYRMVNSVPWLEGTSYDDWLKTR